MIQGIYQIGMLCKHFKGTTLQEKNIYRIEQIDVDGISIMGKNVIYTGDHPNLENVHHLIIYSNIFQEDKIFAREYEDLAYILPKEKQEQFHQMRRVEPLTEEEIFEIGTETFRQKKKEMYRK